MRWIVYETRNLVNGKVYVGKHGQKQEGFDGYFGSGELLILAIKKYGTDNFERRTLREFATEAEALAYEAEVVTEEFCKRPDTYNMKPGGVGGAQTDPEVLARIAAANKGEKNPQYGKKHSAETRAKLSEALKGEKNPQYGKELSAEHRANISKAKKGKKHSAEHCAKLSEGLKGRELSDEHRTNISEAQKGKELSAEHRAKIAESQRRAWERRRAS